MFFKDLMLWTGIPAKVREEMASMSDSSPPGPSVDMHGVVSLEES